jgi:hypothetical protein
LFIAIPLVMIAGVLTVKALRKFTPSVVALASFLIVIGAGAKRYLIVVPTLTAPYLPNTSTNIPFNPVLPFDWVHYRPTWVEWSITFGGTAAFLLMYMLFTKVFPMVSIWETREDGVHGVPAVVPAPQPSAHRLGSVPTMTILLIGCLLFGSTFARADQKKAPAKAPEATTLSLGWQQVATPAATDDTPKQQQTSNGDATGANKLYGQVFGWIPVDSGERAQPAPAMAITATLLDSKGQPLAYQVVGLTLKTSFGKLDFGSRPTNAEGKAKFTIQDRRFGKYTVDGTYDGGDKFAAAHADATVDFGPRPEPALPSQGVLITPYATAWIGIPFLLFFGMIWSVFLYVGIYLLFWRMPQIRKAQAKVTS